MPPSSFKNDPVKINIDMSAFYGSVPPTFNRMIYFLVQAADCSGADPCTPKGLSDIFYPANRYACQIHFYKSFFYADLSSSVTLDNGTVKRNSTKLRNF